MFRPGLKRIEFVTTGGFNALGTKDSERNDSSEQWTHTHKTENSWGVVFWAKLVRYWDLSCDPQIAFHKSRIGISDHKIRKYKVYYTVVSVLSGYNLSRRTAVKCSVAVVKSLPYYKCCFTISPLFCDITKSNLWYHKIDCVISLIIMWNHHSFVISQIDFVISLIRFCYITYSILWYHKINFVISHILIYSVISI